MGWFFTVNSKMSSKKTWARVAPGGTIKQSRNVAALHLLDRDTAAYAMVVDKNSDIWLNLRRVYYSFLFSVL